MLAQLLQQKRVPTLELPVEVRRKMWVIPFIKSYLVVFICYMTMYLVRKNFNVAANDLISTYGLSLTQLGIIGLGFSVTYGLGKTALNYWADGKNTKNILPLGLLLSGLCMFGFGLVLGKGNISFILMVGLYSLSGLFQSTGGSNSYSTITKWTARKNRGLFLGMWNISHNLGGAGAAGAALFGASYFFNGNVVGMFIFPAVIAVVVALIGFFVGNDSPEAYGLGMAEEIFNEQISEEDKTVQKEKMTKFEIFKKYILFNKVIWLLCFANVFLYIVRIGIDQWATVYGHEILGFDTITAISGFTMFETGALVGTCLWGFFSDLANGRRGLFACIALVGVIVGLHFYQHATTIFAYRASLFCLGFLVFGPQLLIGVAAVGFVPKQGVAVADGIKGTFAYLIGDSFAKLGLGLIADGRSIFGCTGWKGTFLALQTATVVCFVIMALVAICEERKIRRMK